MAAENIQGLIERASSHYSDEEVAALVEDVVFIVSAPRAGSTLLFKLLSNCPDIWTIGSESHRIYAQLPHLPGPRNFTGDSRLYAEHADPETTKRMRLIYLALLRDPTGRPLLDALESGDRKFTVLEKTPRNSLNIKFLLRVFPKARFIYLTRDARENIASLIEGWRVGAEGRRFVTYRGLPDWPLGYWCFVLPPGWETVKGQSLAEIAAFQWRACNDIVLDDLSELPRERWTMISYADLIKHPSSELVRLCDFMGVDPGEYLAARTPDNLPLSPSIVTPPRKDKWREHEADIETAMPYIQSAIDRIANLS